MRRLWEFDSEPVEKLLARYRRSRHLYRVSRHCVSFSGIGYFSVIDHGCMPSSGSIQCRRLIAKSARALIAQELDSQEPDSQEPDSQEPDSQEPDSQEPDSQELDSQELDHERP